MKGWRNPWVVVSGVWGSVYLAAACTVSRGTGLTAFGNLTALLLLLVASAVMAKNALATRGQARAFWILTTIGFALWLLNQGLWTHYEVVERREIPDPFIGDIILFLHVVPLMAAVAMRPHQLETDERRHFSTLDFIMLLLWWVFLYAFFVFPNEYVTLNVPAYGNSYNVLYLVEEILWVGALAMAAASARGAWRRIYLHFLVATTLYTMGSAVMNQAISRHRYYTGSLYDIPYMVSLCWFVWVGLQAMKWKPQPEPEPQHQGWVGLLATRLSMVAILSLPVFAFWVLRFDTSPPRLRYFRLLAAMMATLLMGALLFCKQYMLDRRLIELLDENYRDYDNLQRLQKQVVQREKLASLGQFVAGAAHEINQPLAAIVNCADQLAGQTSLTAQQTSLAGKIRLQARRTHELVADLLSFAQQTPTEKSLVQMDALLQRAVQMEMRPGTGIAVETRIAPGIPKVFGNASQLLQVCAQIIGNASDSLEEAGGGALTLTAQAEGNEVVVEFSDTGSGMLEPERVFDPFYTTKPVGKGTGLGLSAAYGVVLNHNGQITCRNRPEGGAVFTLRLPAAANVQAASAEAGS